MWTACALAISVSVVTVSENEGEAADGRQEGRWREGGIHTCGRVQSCQQLHIDVCMRVVEW